MKKAASILLIAILFFNWYGYRIVVHVLAQKADERLEIKLDGNQYKEDQLINVRIPLNVPYQNDQAEFERYYGKIEIDGKLYTYVKRKIEHGYLMLKCIPNETKQRVTTAGNEYFKVTNGLTQPGERATNKNIGKNFWSEYDSNENHFECLGFTCSVITGFVYSTPLYSDRSPSVSTPPPDFTSNSPLHL